jgi:hypothetical protein
MRGRRFPKLVWAGAACALGIVLGSCTPGGQFDPTELLSNDIFNTKKTIQGDREPLFPNGVPGAETGVPPDLVKGYQPPPDQAATAESADTTAKPVTTAEKPKAKPKPRPKPAIAKASPAAPKMPASANSPWPAPAQPASAPTNWPTPPGGSPSPAAAQTNWPPPPGSSQSSAPAQTNWPPPPGAQTQQGAQSGQTNWPNPPGQATSSH